MSKAQELQQLDFYESTLNNLTEGVVWTDSEGAVVYSNDASARWFGTTKRELLNQSIYSLLPDADIVSWLATLSKKVSGQSQLPLNVTLRNGSKVNVYAIVSIVVGTNKY